MTIKEVKIQNPQLYLNQVFSSFHLMQIWKWCSPKTWNTTNSKGVPKVQWILLRQQVLVLLSHLAESLNEEVQYPVLQQPLLWLLLVPLFHQSCHHSLYFACASISSFAPKMKDILLPREFWRFWNTGYWNNQRYINVHFFNTKAMCSSNTKFLYLL